MRQLLGDHDVFGSPASRALPPAQRAARVRRLRAATDDEKIEAIAHEAARGLKLLTNVLMERPGLYRGAAAALWRVASSKLAEQLRPSPA